MKTILAKCEHADLEYISEVLDSYMLFTDDSGREQLLVRSKVSEAKKSELIALIDKQIRYYGSSDIAYAVRSIFSSEGGAFLRLS